MILKFEGRITCKVAISDFLLIHANLVFSKKKNFELLRNYIKVDTKQIQENLLRETARGIPAAAQPVPEGVPQFCPVLVGGG